MLENFSVLSTRLYFTYIKPMQHFAYKIIFQNLISSRLGMILGHPRAMMMRKNISNSIDKFSKPLDLVCTACAKKN